MSTRSPEPLSASRELCLWSELPGLFTIGLGRSFYGGSIRSAPAAGP